MKNQIVRMVQKLSYHCIGCYPCNYSIIRIRHSHRSISLHLLKLLLLLLKLQHLLIQLLVSRNLMHRQAHLHLDVVEELADSLLSPQVLLEKLITLQLENVNCNGNATVDSPLVLLLLFLPRHLLFQLLPAVDYRLHVLRTLLALSCHGRWDFGTRLHKLLHQRILGCVSCRNSVLRRLLHPAHEVFIIFVQARVAGMRPLPYEGLI